MQDDMTIAQDEIFGPVMALMKFKYVYIYTCVSSLKQHLFFSFLSV
jgi:hypothetical protein